MAIQGERRPDIARKVGMFSGAVVAINPTATQIQELFSLEEPLEKEPEYVTEKDEEVPDHMGEDGQVVKVGRVVKGCRIDIYVKDQNADDVTGSGITKMSFFLKARPFMKKDLTKSQYINSLGKVAWVDTPDNLPSRFTHTIDKLGNKTDPLEFHQSIMGESDLIEFLDNWLAIQKKKKYELAVTTDAFFRGDFRELQGLVNSELASLFAGCYTVRAVDDNGGTQFYQSIWKRILPAFTLKFFTAGMVTPEKLRDLQEREVALRTKIVNKQSINNNEWLSNWEKFILEIGDEQGGCKDFYSLDPAHAFDPATHYATQAASIQPASNEY